MKKRKKSIIVIILIIVAIVTAILVIWFLNNRNKQYATTTVEDRETWNERLNDNPYLSEFDKLSVNILGLPNSELLKLALTSNYVKAEKITEEEKMKILI